MKSQKIILALVLVSGVSASSCSMLSGLLGGLGGGDTDLVGGETSLALSGAPNADMNLNAGTNNAKIGYVASASDAGDANADAGYLYGIFADK